MRTKNKMQRINSKRVPPRSKRRKEEAEKDDDNNKKEKINYKTII
jgi:hypothetical protein